MILPNALLKENQLVLKRGQRQIRHTNKNSVCTREINGK